ncbi:MAG: hypothetical protein SGBAC_006687, partial [Bacillariaceae sp.]
MAINFDSTSMLLSNDDTIDDDIFNLDKTELDPLPLNLPRQVADDEGDVKFDVLHDEWDVEFEPIPLDETKPGHEIETFEEYASALDFCFCNTNTPVLDVKHIQGFTRKQKRPACQAKKTKSTLAHKKQKPAARS